MKDTVTFASQLNGNEYANEGSNELFQAMKDAGFVAVFGASDDLMEFRGAIDDVVGCYDGGFAYLTNAGLFQEMCTSSNRCPHEAALKEKCSTIEAVWDEGDYSWSYKTTIPHETFIINDDDEPYCRGIVFKLSDAAQGQ
jgi:hypothetical protein